MNLRKVLVITYYWPPAAGPGVQRFLKFCKYFHEFGWQPIVLTVKDGSYPSIDTSLEKDVPDSMEVVKTKTFEPFSAYNKLRGGKGNEIPVSLIGIKEDKRLIQKLSLFIRANFFIPDARKGWKPYAIKAAEDLIATHEIDVIVTTGPPQSVHLIGLALKKKFNIPWVTDFRDPWTNVFYNKFFPRTNATKRKDQSFEDEVLKNSDAVTVVSNGLVKEFEDRAKSIEVIYNGFDHSDMPDPGSITTEKFNLEYIGNLKPNQNVTAVWQALSELSDENKSFSEDYKLSLTGNIDGFILKDMQSIKLNLSVSSYVPHSEAIDRMIKTNMLLFIVPEAENNNLIITGKLFEYMATKTPMLSVGPPDGDAAKLLLEGERDPMIAYNGKDAVKALILKYYNSWKESNGIKQFHESTDLMKFSRKELTGRFSSLLNSLVE